MSGTAVLLHMAGAVALLLWATRMVRTGVERAYGAMLKRRLKKALTNPLLAMADSVPGSGVGNPIVAPLLA